MICLTCKEKLAVLNLKRPYAMKRGKNYKGDDRTKRSKQLQRGRWSQQDLFLNVGKEADGAGEASYLVSELLTKVKKSFAGGQFLKDCMLMFYVEDHCDIHCATCPNIIPLFALRKRIFLFIFNLNMFI